MSHSSAEKLFSDTREAVALEPNMYAATPKHLDRATLNRLHGQAIDDDLQHDYPSSDPGPVPPATESDRQLADRIRGIAAIHALAQWLTDHPDAPMPHTIDVRVSAGTIWTPDAARMDTLERFAEVHGAHRYALPSDDGKRRHEYAKLILATTPHHGLDINYTLSTTLTDSESKGV